MIYNIQVVIKLNQNNMKQTAVEWLVDESMKLVAQVMTGTLNEDTLEDDVYRIVTKAKEMEKDNTKKLLEIIMWYDEQSDVRPNTEIYTWFQQYYNETFKSE